MQDYVHRIGRTGRGGKEGQSITFFTEEDKAHAGELIRILKDANQAVPDEMDRFPTSELRCLERLPFHLLLNKMQLDRYLSAIKKKTHSSYGAHFKELVPGRAK